MLENVLNNVIDQEADEVRLYFFVLNESDVLALSEYEAVGYGKLDVVKVGGEEIRKEIVDYYKDLFEKVGSSLRVFSRLRRNWSVMKRLGLSKL